ncbi:MAG: DUF3592 domain-containing protein [Pseudarcicella sp.]|nr:DUF3592 domain-containing protein [Pseudarcicella sp.]MBP6410995.1 DUF3592 domain-containing protein [Pseudarcicella sp.]
MLAYTLLIAGKHTETTVEQSAMFSYLLMGISLTMIVAGLYFLKKRKDWLATSIVTEGVIVEATRRYDRTDYSGSNPMFFPIVSFLVKEREYRIETQKGSNIAPKFGDTMLLRYNPENPYDSALGEMSVPTQTPTLYLVLGAAMFLSSIIIL